MEVLASQSIPHQTFLNTAYHECFLGPSTSLANYRNPGGNSFVYKCLLQVLIGAEHSILDEVQLTANTSGYIDWNCHFFRTIPTFNTLSCYHNNYMANTNRCNNQLFLKMWSWADLGCSYNNVCGEIGQRQLGKDHLRYYFLHDIVYCIICYNNYYLILLLPL